MNYGKIFRQAWSNVISYRALWIFGMILALTTSASSTNVAWNTNSEETGRLFNGEGIIVNRGPDESFGEAFGRAWDEAWDEVKRDIERDFGSADRDLESFFREELDVRYRSNILAFLTILLWILVISFIIGRFLRYMSETALITMVDEQEETGEQHNVRYGFRKGWSRTSWRLFLIDLAIDIPAAIFFILLFGLIFTPLLVWQLGSVGLGVFSVVLTSGLFFLFIFLAIVFGQVIGVLKNFMRRACAIEGLGVMDSIRSGFRVVRRQLKESGLVWLVLVGVNIVWPLVIAIFAIFLVAVAIVIGGALGLLTGLTANVFGAANPAVVGLIVGGPLFLLTLILPLILLGGMKEVFESSTWTLVYREFKGFEALAELPLPDLPEMDQALEAGDKEVVDEAETEGGEEETE